MGSLSLFLDFLYNIPLIQAILAATLVFLCIYYGISQLRGLPPGPRGIPILGYWPFLRQENAHLQVQELRDKYGEVFSFTATGHLYICLNSMKVIKEAHVGKSECFEDRFSDYSLLTLSFEEAVSIVNGESWKVQRKFFQQKFKEYGMLAIKENFSGAVYDTLKDTVEEVRELKGEPTSITEILTVKCSSIIRRILFNDQGITEEELKELNREYGPVLASMTHKNLLLMGNIARYLVFPFMPSYWAMLRSHNRIQNILRNVIVRHKANFDDTQVMDIIDCFHKEKKDREMKGDPSAKYFTDKALLSSVYQFVTDGVLTIAYFIAMFLEKLVECPEEQDKIYEELMDVLGPDRQPTMEDRSSLPYTTAFLYEVIRCTDFFVMFPSLKCTKETTLHGYRIPKGAITLIMGWCANHDPNVYEEPDSFNPSRFVTVPGKQKTQLPILFGIGKRACMGEAFAMIQAFLFVATIVKNFHLTKPEGADNSFNVLLAGGLQICAHARTQDAQGKAK